MNTCYLLLGGNIGDSALKLKQAIALIEQKIGATLKKSSVFKTAAWGNKDQADFYNQAIILETLNAPTELLANILKIEELLGRTRTNDRWQERTIDIDILFYNKEIIDLPDLKIPHPYIQERKFVLVPMNEIAGNFVHPILKKTIEELLNECVDSCEVQIEK